MTRKPLGSLSLAALVVSVSLLCAGCAVPLETSYESRQAYVETHELSNDVTEAILAGRVIVGMTKEEVEATWGWASETDTSEAYGMNLEWGREVWYYHSHSTFIGPEAEVHFNNGQVEAVSPTH